jgi:hypothetical protein
MWKKAVVTFEVVGGGSLELQRTDRETQKISRKEHCNTFKFGTSQIQHYGIIAALIS